jgi:selenocysteine-specific elongation factor
VKVSPRRDGGGAACAPYEGPGDRPHVVLVCAPAQAQPIQGANARPLLSGRAQDALDTLCARLRGDPFGAPGQLELAELGLTTPHLRAAVDRGLLFRVEQGVYVHPDAVRLALARLAPPPQPFTLSAGRRRLGTSRRVAVPLFELLDRLGHTRSTPDGLRHLVASSDATP